MGRLIRFSGEKRQFHSHIDIASASVAAIRNRGFNNSAAFSFHFA
jgi:hypothetical protein